MFYKSPFNLEPFFNEIENDPNKDLLLDVLEKLEKDLFEEGQLLLKEIINTVDKSKNALVLSSLYSFEDESIKMFEKRHIESLKKAAEHKNPSALYGVGLYYDTGGCSLTYDSDVANDYFIESAKKGFASGMYIYGTMIYYSTKQVEKNQEQGLKMIKDAAAKGDSLAKKFLENENIK